jgi:transcriptional regulator with XRE-family HTH domain
VETPDTEAPADETFPQALAALKAEYGDSEPKIADAIGVHVSTVNNWINGKAEPRAKYIRALAQEYPKSTEARLFSALGKRAPAPQTDDEREETLKVLDRLTEEQRRMLLIQAKAVADSNDQ